MTNFTMKSMFVKTGTSVCLHPWMYMCGELISQCLLMVSPSNFRVTGGNPVKHSVGLSAIPTGDIKDSYSHNFIINLHERKIAFINNFFSYILGGYW